MGRIADRADRLAKRVFRRDLTPTAERPKQLADLQERLRRKREKVLRMGRGL